MNIQEGVTECASRELKSVFDYLGNPESLTIDMLCDACKEIENCFPFFVERSNFQNVRLIKLMGYRRVDNPYTASGEWRFGNLKKIVYVRSDIDSLSAYSAIKNLIRHSAREFH